MYKKFLFLYFLIAGSLSYASIDIPCGLFSNFLSTRANGSEIKVKGISRAYVDNCKVLTSKVEENHDNNRLICEKTGKNVIASGKYGKSLNESSIFTWEFNDSIADNNFNDGDKIEISLPFTVLSKNKYKEITQNWHHFSFSFHPDNNSRQLNIKKFDNIMNNVSFDNVSGKDINIGEFKTADYGTTKIILDNIPNNINIYKLSVSGSNVFKTSLTARESINITEMDIKSAGADTIILKAPVVRIAYQKKHKMNLKNDNNHIIIYADKIYIGEIDFGQKNSLEIYPYTKGNNVNLHIRQLNFSSNSNMIMSGGDYYVQDINIAGTGQNIVLMKPSDINQIVNLIIENNFKIKDSYAINSDGAYGHFGNYKPTHFRIFVNGNMELGSGGTTLNALIYTTGKVKIKDHVYIKGAISSKDDIFISNNDFFYWSKDIDDEGFSKCNISEVSSPVNNIANAGDGNSLFGQIQTKIVNHPFYLNIFGFIYKNNNSFSFNSFEGNNNNIVLMQYQLYDMNHHKGITAWQNLDNFDKIYAKFDYYSNVSFFNNNLNKEMKSNGKLIFGEKKAKFNINKAYRNVRVKIRFCGNFNITSGLFRITDLNNCSYGLFSRILGFKYFYLYSFDNFAIRPYAFKLFTDNTYKKAGENFKIYLKAVDENNYNKKGVELNSISGVENYNESVDNLNFSYDFYKPTDDEVKQMNKDIYGKESVDFNKVAKCPDKGSLSIQNTNIVNGNADIFANLSESGIYTLNVKEIPGKEFAAVDEDDTPDSLRYIKPAKYIFNSNNSGEKTLVEVIPYKLKITSDFKTTVNGSNWVYMSNNPENMGSFIDYKITAYNKQGKLLKNYTNSCFSDDTKNSPLNGKLKLNTTFGININTELNSDKSINIKVLNEKTKELKNINLNKGENNINIDTVKSINFNNGEYSNKIYFNIAKNYTKPVNPVNITLEKIYTIPKFKELADEYSVNKTISYFYGRIIFSNTSGIGDTVNSKIKYGYWNNGWVLNTKHNNNFGQIDYNHSFYNGKKLSETKLTVNKGTIENGIENDIFKTSEKLPYGIKIDLNIPEWLWYHPLATGFEEPSADNLDCLTHPCMQIIFSNDSKTWGGVSVSNNGNSKFKTENKTVNDKTSESNSDNTEAVFW